MTSNLEPAGGRIDERVLEFSLEIATRLREEPDLDDFLAWRAGTLEYWIHIVASSVASRQGWASRTEVPYVTAAPNPGTKSNTKWADGAMLFGNLGVLLEVKTIAARRGIIGPTLRKVPQDFAALAALDWPATLLQLPRPVLRRCLGRSAKGHGSRVPTPARFDPCYERRATASGFGCSAGSQSSNRRRS